MRLLPCMWLLPCVMPGMSLALTPHLATAGVRASGPLGHSGCDTVAHSVDIVRRGAWLAR